MSIKDKLYLEGVDLAERFCRHNGVQMPKLERLTEKDRLYHLATCAFYRPTTIHIMVEKCASPGYGGRAWSWPGYVIDRTPYGVVQHELGHHVDHFITSTTGTLFSWQIYERSLEPALTGYLGTDQAMETFYKEWFAEHFRLFVTNPDLLRMLRPKFCAAIQSGGIKAVVEDGLETVLRRHGANDRILSQTQKKLIEATQRTSREVHRRYDGAFRLQDGLFTKAEIDTLLEH